MKYDNNIWDPKYLEDSIKSLGRDVKLDVDMTEDPGWYDDLMSSFGASIYVCLRDWLYSKRFVIRKDLTQYYNREKESEYDLFIGSEYIYKLPNGYGARVEKSEKSLGGTLNLWQVTPLIWIDILDDDGKVIGHDYSITPDSQLVKEGLSKKGSLTLKEVIAYLLQLDQLDEDLKGYDEDDE